jgi:hypothetical protein
VAVIDTTGTVNWVKVSGASDLATFQIATAGTTETFLLWWLGSSPDPPTTTQRLLWTTELSLLRDALTNKLTVTITHDDTSGKIVNVQLNQG